MIKKEYLGTLVPPLPAKQAVKSVLDRFSVEFVRRRCAALKDFLHRLRNGSNFLIGID